MDSNDDLTDSSCYKLMDPNDGIRFTFMSNNIEYHETNRLRDVQNDSKDPNGIIELNYKLDFGSYHIILLSVIMHAVCLLMI